MIPFIFRYTKIYISQRKSIAVLLMLSLFSLFYASCSKEATPPGTASLTLVNAIPGSGTLKVNFKSEGHLLYSKAVNIDYPRALQTVQLPTGTPQRVRFFQVPDTTDKDAPLVDLKLELPLGSMHTLFLAGTPDAPDTLLKKEEHIPFFPQGDSAMAIRFLNLSKGSNPVSINIRGLADGSEATSLGYKSMSDFKRYGVSLAMEDYVFEFRDASTGTLLTSFTTSGLREVAPNNWVFRSFTLAFISLPGETGFLGPRAYLIKHY